MDTLEINPIEEAQRVLEADRKQRAEQFQNELVALEKKHNCTIGITYVQNNPNLPSVANIQIIPL